MSLKRSPLILAVLIALAAPNAASAAESETVFGLTRAGGLVTFDSTSPGTAAVAVPITGLAVGETIVGIDTQPATGRLFAVTSASKVFTINKTTGAATQVGTTAFSPVVEPTATSFGVDFNPVPNAIRFLSSGPGTNQSLRISPATGAVAGTDTPPASTTAVADAAYTNSVAGANSTTLYVIDATSGQLKRIGGLGGSPSPNGGAVTSVGSLGATSNGDVGFDVSGATNTAYVSLQTVTGTARFATIDLATGQVSALPQQIGAVPTDVVDIAIATQPPSVQFSAAASAVSEGAGTAAVTVTRTGNTDGVSNVTVSTTTTGTATAGSDFTAVTAQAFQFAGETSKTVSIPIADDSAVETPETIAVSVALAAASPGASLGAPNATTVTVFDNDPATVAGPAVSVPFTPAANQVFLSDAPNRVNRSSLVSKGLSFTASCSETCVLGYTLKIGDTVLGTATAQRTGAGLVFVKLLLFDGGKTALNSALQSKRPASKLIRLESTATDSDGGAAVKAATSIRVYRT